MGQYVSGHPMDGYDASETLVEQVTGCRLKPEVEVVLREDGTEEEVEGRRDTFGVGGVRGRLYPALGVVTQREDKTTKTGKPYAIVFVQDADDRVTKLFAWSETLDRFGAHLVEGAKVLAIGKENDDFPDSLEAVVPAQEIVSEWARFAVVNCLSEGQVAAAHAVASEFARAGGDCEVVYQLGDAMLQGPAVRLSPERVRRLSHIADIFLFCKAPTPDFSGGLKPDIRDT